MSERGEKQLISLHINKIDYSIIPDPKTEFRPALKPAVWK